MPPKAKKKTDAASKKVAAKKKEKVSFCLLGCSPMAVSDDYTFMCTCAVCTLLTLCYMYSLVD
jgi:hypothetical protein